MWAYLEPNPVASELAGHGAFDQRFGTGLAIFLQQVPLEAADGARIAGLAAGAPVEGAIQYKVGQMVKELTHFTRGGI